MLNLAQMNATQYTLTDLKQLILDIQSRVDTVERALDGDIDPRWPVVACRVRAHTDTASEAATQAQLAAGGGDEKRARARIKVARDELQRAAECLSQYQHETA